LSGLGYFGCLKFFGALDYIAPFSPTIAAFILTYTSEGFRWGEKRGIDFSFGKLWLIPHILINANYWIVTPFSNSVVNQPLKCGGGSCLSYRLLSQHILFLGGPVAEEFGWERIRHRQITSQV